MRKYICAVAAVLLIGVVASITGCGGGGGGSPAAVPPSPTTAKLKLSINNLPAGVKVGALQIHFSLPAGVAPATLAGNDASGSIIVNMAGSINMASFVSPVITIGAISTGGFSSGEYGVMNCTINPGTTVSAASFPAQATIDVADDTGSPSLPIVGLTVPIVVTLQ